MKGNTRYLCLSANAIANSIATGTAIGTVTATAIATVTATAIATATAIDTYVRIFARSYRSECQICAGTHLRSRIRNVLAILFKDVRIVFKSGRRTSINLKGIRSRNFSHVSYTTWVCDASLTKRSDSGSSARFREFYVCRFRMRNSTIRGKRKGRKRNEKN